MKTRRPRLLRHLAVLSLAVLSIAAAPATEGDGTAEDTETVAPQDGDVPDEEATSTEDTSTSTTSSSDETTSSEDTSTSTTSSSDETTSSEDTSTSTTSSSDETTSSQDTSTSESQTTTTEPASSEDTESEPDASATAVEVEDVLIISQATASEGAASATVLSLGGERLVGGDAEGGSSAGAIFDTGDTELGRLAVGPWSATTNDSGSNSEASVAKVTVIDEDTFYAHVLRSRAAASGDGGTSASSDAVAVGIGGEDEIRVLSSTWSADGPESALIRQGDETIGQDADGQCQLEVPSVLALLCLTGSDGQGGTLVPGDNDDAEFASVAEAVLFEEQGVALLRAGGDSDPATATDLGTEQDGSQDDTAESPSPGTDDGDLAAAPDTGPDTGPDTRGSSLPVTGGGVTVLAIGLLLLAAGLALRRRAALTG